MKTFKVLISEFGSFENREMNESTKADAKAKEHSILTKHHEDLIKYHRDSIRNLKHAGKNDSLGRTSINFHLSEIKRHQLNAEKHRRLSRKILHTQSRHRFVGDMVVK